MAHPDITRSSNLKFGAVVLEKRRLQVSSRITAHCLGKLPKTETFREPRRITSGLAVTREQSRNSLITLENPASHRPLDHGRKKAMLFPQKFSTIHALLSPCDGISRIACRPSGD